MMEASELRRLMTALEDRVRLAGPGREIVFDRPGAEDLLAAGFDAAAVHQLLNAPWWAEMIADIVETPGFCGADEEPEQVLRYAKDVVTETLRKRFQRV